MFGFEQKMENSAVQPNEKIGFIEKMKSLVKEGAAWSAEKLLKGQELVSDNKELISGLLLIGAGTSLAGVTVAREQIEKGGELTPAGALVVFGAIIDIVGGLIASGKFKGLDFGFTGGGMREAI